MDSRLDYITFVYCQDNSLKINYKNVKLFKKEVLCKGYYIQLQFA